MKISAQKQFRGVFQIPGDKSITHRSIMFNAAAEGDAVVTNALLGEDCLSTIRCMRALGADIKVSGNTIFVHGSPEFRSADCDCGNSGTTMRLLMGLVSGKNIRATLTGDSSLSSRPMERVAAPLRLLGADIRTTNGKAPVEVYPAELTGRTIDTQVASAQVKSALLLAGLSAAGEMRVREPLKSRDHTERMLSAMGADLRVNGNEVCIRPGKLRCMDVDVPADISSAAYFMALGALCGETLCKNVGINPTRTGILKVFDEMNVRYVLEDEHSVCGEPVADIRVFRSELSPVHLTKEIMPALIDELPVIAVLCAFAKGESLIEGAEELRVKESDRIASTAELINSLGGECIPREDGFIIRGKGMLCGGRVKSYGDHRIAMSGAVALTGSRNGGEIEDAECVAISFPDFYTFLNKGGISC